MLSCIQAVYVMAYKKSSADNESNKIYHKFNQFPQVNLFYQQYF
jgi:hypothetical protein